MAPPQDEISFVCTYKDLLESCFVLKQTAYQTGVDFLTVDTEFIRRDTYFPQLSLIQVGLPHRAFVFDVLAFLSEQLAPLLNILYDPKIVKVFHAARQDCEAFLHAFGKIPSPLFDTQIAHALLSFDNVIGYEALVKEMLGIHIDKTYQTSQWLDRPLEEQQILYAAHDVTHLCSLYPLLKEKLSNEKRLDLAFQESALFLDKTLYEVDASRLWEKQPFNPKQWAAAVTMKYLLAWREAKAIALDKPKGHILSEQSLLYIALHVTDIPIKTKIFEEALDPIITEALRPSKRLSLLTLEEHNLLPSLKNVLFQARHLCQHMPAKQIALWKKEISALQIRDTNNQTHQLKIFLKKLCRKCALKNRISLWLFAPQTAVKQMAQDILKAQRLKNPWASKSLLARGWRRKLLAPFKQNIITFLNQQR